MSTDPSFEQLQRDVQYVKDRFAIQDCIMRLARGVDRHDAELMSSSFHPDAEIKHGNRAEYVRGADYGQWSNGAHEGGRFALHSHQITNMNVEIDGDTAYAESYVITFFMAGDEKTVALVAGRYVDQLDKRDDEWRISKRRAFLDIAGDAPATYLGTARGTPVDRQQFWSKADVSYQRPIDLSTPSPQWS
jgi:hypothetical protein